MTREEAKRIYIEKNAYKRGYEDAKKELDRPHGEWIDHSDEGYVECPFCEHATNCDDNIEELHFCFYCGASMIPSNSEIEKSNSEICPCIECCKIDNSEPCRKGCSEYQKWKEGEAE